jgi:hypothetical protein
VVRRKTLPDAINIQITLTSLLQGFSLGKNHRRSHLERAGCSYFLELCLFGSGFKFLVVSDIYNHQAFPEFAVVVDRKMQ